LTSVFVVLIGRRYISSRVNEMARGAFATLLSAKAQRSAALRFIRERADAVFQCGQLKAPCTKRVNCWVKLGSNTDKPHFIRQRGATVRSMWR
jgi:hypothetical protein